MNVNDMFPSKWLSAEDIGPAGTRRTATIDSVTMEEVEQGKPSKPVLWFKGESKGLVLNKTNGKAIAKMYGKDADHWGGRPVTLYTTYVDFKNDQVLATRVEPVAPQEPQQPGLEPPPPTDADMPPADDAAF